MVNTNQLMALSVETFDAYLNSIHKIPRLTPEEEHNLAVQLVEHNDLEAAHKLVMSNLNFVVHIARGFSGYKLPLADLVQEGNIGLMKAVKRFDPYNGVRLVSYAVHYIKEQIYNYVIKNWGIVKIATTKPQRKLFFNISKYKTGNSLSKDDALIISETLNVPLSEVYEMDHRLYSGDVSFDTVVSDDVDFGPETYLFVDYNDPAKIIENNNGTEYDLNMLANALQELDPRKLDIIESRWLSNDKATLWDLAAKYNISAERIRQLELEAIEKLKVFLSTTELSY